MADPPEQPKYVCLGRSPAYPQGRYIRADRAEHIAQVEYGNKDMALYPIDIADASGNIRRRFRFYSLRPRNDLYKRNSNRLKDHCGLNLLGIEICILKDLGQKAFESLRSAIHRNYKTGQGQAKKTLYEMECLWEVDKYGRLLYTFDPANRPHFQPIKTSAKKKMNSGAVSNDATKKHNFDLFKRAMAAHANFPTLNSYFEGYTDDTLRMSVVEGREVFCAYHLQALPMIETDDLSAFLDYLPDPASVMYASGMLNEALENPRVYQERILNAVEEARMMQRNRQVENREIATNAVRFAQPAPEQGEGGAAGVHEGGRNDLEDAEIPDLVGDDDGDDVGPDVGGGQGDGEEEEDDLADDDDDDDDDDDYGAPIFGGNDEDGGGPVDDNDDDGGAPLFGGGDDDDVRLIVVTYNNLQAILLEDRVRRRRRAMAILIQAVVRGMQARRLPIIVQWRNMQTLALSLNFCYIRNYLYGEREKMVRGFTRMQSLFRGYQKRKNWDDERDRKVGAIVVIQTAFRVGQARRVFECRKRAHQARLVYEDRKRRKREQEKAEKMSTLELSLNYCFIQNVLEVVREEQVSARRRINAAMRIQARARGMPIRRRFQATRFWASRLQARARGNQIRRRIQAARSWAMARGVQRRRRETKSKRFWATVANCRMGCLCVLVVWWVFRRVSLADSMTKFRLPSQADYYSMTKGGMVMFTTEQLANLLELVLFVVAYQCTASLRHLIIAVGCFGLVAVSGWVFHFGLVSYWSVTKGGVVIITTKQLAYLLIELFLFMAMYRCTAYLWYLFAEQLAFQDIRLAEERRRAADIRAAEERRRLAERRRPISDLLEGPVTVEEGEEDDDM